MSKEVEERGFEAAMILAEEGREKAEKRVKELEAQLAAFANPDDPALLRSAVLRLIQHPEEAIPTDEHMGAYEQINDAVLVRCGQAVEAWQEKERKG